VFEGIQNHTVTTRIAIRTDAGVAAARLQYAIAERFPDITGPRSVWTTGRVTVSPDAASIIPGGAEILFQFRDEDKAMLKRFDTALRDLVEETSARTGCASSIERIANGQHRRMDEAFQDALERAAELHCADSHTRMPSGAGQDAQLVARKMRAGMLFVPNIGGISHHWTENTEDADLGKLHL